MAHPDVLVVGGGIIGLAAARELAGAGFTVELLERRTAGAEASTAAAGMLAPLVETPAPGLFFAACRASRDLWLSWVPALSEESGLTIDHDTTGAFVLALDEAEDDGLTRLAAAAHAVGEPVEELAPAELQRAVPDVSPAVRRALHLHGEHRLDNIQACAALALSARRRGVEIRHPWPVERIEKIEAPGGDAVRVHGPEGTREAGLLVLAAGAWSGTLPGLPFLPVRPVRGQMLMLGGVTWPFRGSVRGAHGYSVRRGETGLLVGATVEEAGYAPHTTVAGIAGLLAFVRRLFPGLGDARLEAVWAGLRPGTPDDLPLIGRLPGWPAIVATGHFRNGILLAPWTARQVAQLAAGTESREELAPFRPERFLGGNALPFRLGEERV